MKITRRQLRRIIKESLASDSDRIFSALEEMGYNIDMDIAVDSNQTAINDALAGYPGEFTYEDVVNAVADQKAASEILATRMGDYSSSPYGKKIDEGVDPRGLKTLLKGLGVTKAFRGVSEALSTAFYEFEGDAADMKEEVEVASGGYRDDRGQAINWPLDVYQQIHDLYSKKKASYRAQRRY